jgi:carbon monoxide dehydrogenase subunit G
VGMRFEGKERFEVPPGALYERLTDFGMLQKFIPGLESATAVDENKMQCVVRPGLSFVRGNLRLEMEMLEREPPSLARMRVHGKGIGNDATIESVLRLTPIDEGTGSELHWSAEIVHLGGLLKAVSKGLIQAAANKVVEHTWAQLRSELGLPPKV